MAHRKKLWWLLISEFNLDIGESKNSKIYNFCISKKSHQKLESRNEKDSESNLIQNQILKWVLYSQFIELSLNPYLRHNIWNHFNPDHSITAHLTRWIQSQRYQWLINQDSWALSKSQAPGMIFDLTLRNRQKWFGNESLFQTLSKCRSGYSHVGNITWKNYL